jgi:cytochrome c oxidase subunit 4
MAASTIRAQTYVIVCVVLVLLTILTVGLSFWEMPPAWHMAAGLIIACFKASLVILFFMQVLTSPRLVWIVICVCGFWLALLFVLTLADYLTRGMIPIAPGH